MTLIQTVVTDDFVIQVSDRRLTIGKERGKSAVIDDEDATKLVSWNDRFTVGFTGLARMDRRQKEPTALWIAEILSEASHFIGGLESLRVAAGKQMKRLPKLWDRRLAIVAAGFDPLGRPCIGIVTNFDTRTGKSTNLEEFRGDGGHLSNPKSYGVHSAGAVLSMENQKVLSRYVPRLLRRPEGHSSQGINRAVRVLVQNQRILSAKDKTVGADALCVFIPGEQSGGFPGGPGASFWMSNLGGPDIPTTVNSFGFFDRRGWLFEQKAPLVANYRMGVREFWASADPDNPDNQTISMRMHKKPNGW